MGKDAACAVFAFGSIGKRTPSAGFTILTAAHIITAAINPVITKTSSIYPRIFPSRFILPIEATADEIEKNTTGTTTEKTRLRKMSPKGFSFMPNSGLNHPVKLPTAIPKRSISGNLYDFQIVFCLPYVQLSF